VLDGKRIIDCKTAACFNEEKRPFGILKFDMHFQKKVATSWNAFAGDIVVKSRDAIKLHQEKYNVNSVIPHFVPASDFLTDCHQALFFQQDTLVY